MTQQKSAVVLGLCFILMTAAGGCGDLTTVKFNLPPQSYSFNTAQTGVNFPQTELPSVPCADNDSCCAVATQAGIADCTTVVCAGPTDAQTCALTATINTPPQPIDLKKDVSALSSFSNQSVLDITVSKILYDVTTNSMNVDLPPIELFVAPNGTTSASDPAAIRFGSVPVTPAHTTISNGRVDLDPAGQTAFVGFAHHFGTPFVFLARTTLVAPGGTPIPEGAVSLTIRGQLSAKPGF